MSLASFPNCMANNTGVCAGTRWVVRFSLRSARFSASISCSCAHYHIKLQQRTHKTLIFLIKLFTPKRTSWPFQHFIHVAKAHTHTQAHGQRDIHVCSCSLHNCLILFLSLLACFLSFSFGHFFFTNHANAVYNVYLIKVCPAFNVHDFNLFCRWLLVALCNACM